jgi:tetratricopeptide (TPR) repeat protein
MLYDGGYYSKAQNLLILNGKFFINAIHDGEYYYRLGRVTDALKNYKDALEYYELTITSSDTDKYYACSAALNAGLIYEILKKDKLALTYFNKCLSLNPAGYSSSLHQKAKSGIDRVKK